MISSDIYPVPSRLLIDGEIRRMRKNPTVIVHAAGVLAVPSAESVLLINGEHGHVFPHTEIKPDELSLQAMARLVEEELGINGRIITRLQGLHKSRTDSGMPGNVSYVPHRPLDWRVPVLGIVNEQAPLVDANTQWHTLCEAAELFEANPRTDEHDTNLEFLDRTVHALSSL